VQYYNWYATVTSLEVSRLRRDATSMNSIASQESILDLPASTPLHSTPAERNCALLLVLLVCLCICLFLSYFSARSWFSCGQQRRVRLAAGCALQSHVHHAEHSIQQQGQIRTHCAARWEERRGEESRHGKRCEQPFIHAI
jgi:hypothetical protein